MSSHAFAHPLDEREPRLGRVALALAVLVVAATGGAVALGIAAAAGLVHAGTRSTTVIERVPALTASRLTLGGPWGAVYAQSAPGTVEVTVNSSKTVPTPFGDAVAGTGIVLDGRGDILTAAHVLSGVDSVTITFPNGSKRGATVLGQDGPNDVAVVKVDPAGLALHPLSLGNARDLAVGDPLALLGDALGFEDSMSTGVVSGLDRTIEAPGGFTVAQAIQTDAAMNPGNSGGPLLDSHAQVVGIADQIATGAIQLGCSASETSTGVGFAVPIDVVAPELPTLERGQSVAHAALGVETAPSADARASATVATVASGTAAAEAGLRAGDLITAFNGARIATAGDLIAATAEAHPGEHVAVSVLRGGRRLTLTVTLGTQPTHGSSKACGARSR